MLHYSNFINSNIKFNMHTEAKSKNTVELYNDDIFTFDIETTSAWLDNGKPIKYHKFEDEDYWNKKTSVSICYIWQFSYNNQVYFGRRIEEFKKVLDKINKSSLKTIIWVHNLAWEFQFLRNILTVDTVFARDMRKPMKFTAKEYPNIEFRCSYTLTRLSLASWGKQIGLPKMVGDLDYNVLRTPLTPLTATELGYCKRDCEVVYKGILNYLKEYMYQNNIPLTQTGCIRRKVKDLLCDEPYMRFIKTLLPKNALEYKRLLAVFAGGYTHANMYYSNETINGFITHWDFTSSYPTVMCCEKFPMTPWKADFKKQPITKQSAENTAYLIKARFKNVECLTQNTYIQKAKCIELKNPLVDNGRIIKADELVIWITEQDYFIIDEMYDFELEIIEQYTSKKEYLPKKFIEYILELYKNKTSLKGIASEEDLYQQSKQYINSLFGMTVTGFIQANVTFDGTKWTLKPFTEEEVNDKIKKIKSQSWDKEYFLSFSWGCWITAYARRNLFKCLIPNDSRVMYADTDSLFILGDADFTDYNNEVTQKLKAMCDFYNIDFALTRPKTIKGKEKPLGIFDREHDLCEFRTLGAKRYCMREAETNELMLTVSGVPKKAVLDLSNDIDNFKEGFVFDKDTEYLFENEEDKEKVYGINEHKKLHTYNDKQPTVTFPDGFTSTYTYGICLRPTSYSTTIPKEYSDLVNKFSFTKDSIPDYILSNMRNVIV